MRNDLDDLHMIADREPTTLLALAERIEHSRDDMHLVYRETELDELWRWVDADIDMARAGRAAPDEMQRLLALKAEVMAIHDLVGIDIDTKQAARRLRALSARQVAAHNATTAN